MNSDSPHREPTDSHRRRPLWRWPVVVLVVAGMLPFIWGCPDDPVEAHGRDDGEDIDWDVDIEDFEDVSEERDYIRPDYPRPRNPFQPDLNVLNIDTEDDEVEEEVDEDVDELEEYSLSSLELVTIISETTVPRAMFVDPTGFGHFAREGDSIGQRGGEITSIRAEEVEIDKGESGIELVQLRDRVVRPQEDEDTLAEETQAVLDRLGVPEEEREQLGRELEQREEPADDELLAPPD